LGKWREVRAVIKGVSLVSRDLQGKKRNTIPFGIRGIGVAVVKVEVRRNVGCDSVLESEKWS